eukprot:scaffold17546_cov69-Phaeocystis_antarctica.AAC.2
MHSVGKARRVGRVMGGANRTRTQHTNSTVRLHLPLDRASASASSATPRPTPSSESNQRALVAREEGAAAQSKDRVDQQGPHEFALVLSSRAQVAQHLAGAISVQVVLREDVPAALAVRAAQALIHAAHDLDRIIHVVTGQKERPCHVGAKCSRHKLLRVKLQLLALVEAQVQRVKLATQL